MCWLTVATSVCVFFLSGVIEVSCIAPEAEFVRKLLSDVLRDKVLKLEPIKLPTTCGNSGVTLVHNSLSGFESIQVTNDFYYQYEREDREMAHVELHFPNLQFTSTVVTGNSAATTTKSFKHNFKITLYFPKHGECKIEMEEFNVAFMIIEPLVSAQELCPKSKNNCKCKDVTQARKQVRSAVTLKLTAAILEILNGARVTKDVVSTCGYEEQAEPRTLKEFTQAPQSSVNPNLYIRDWRKLKFNESRRNVYS